MAKWSEWNPNSKNPYYVWREQTIGDLESGRTDKFADFGSFGLLKSSQHVTDFWNYQSGLTTKSNSLEEGYAQAIDALKARVPDKVVSHTPNAKVTDLPPYEELPCLDNKETVIIGVIDIGIPLGHSRLRDAEGQTRILAAWQQLATPPSSYLPFGRELLKPQIDNLIAESSGGTHTGWLDEETFNRATGVVDMENTFGTREAAKVASHGAHVTDLAAGCDPGEEGEFAEKVKVIAVNVPNVDILGNSGEFTNGFVLSAVERILALSDAIWQKSFTSDSTQPPEPCPCPIIINISLGKQAGAKNSIDLFLSLIHI